MPRPGTVMVGGAMRAMTATSVTRAIFAFARIAKGQRRCAENQGAGEEDREINFHALQCGMLEENRRC